MSYKISLAMNTTLLTIFSYDVTPWSLVGLVGVAMFSLRWLVQLVASTRAKQSVVPVAFWHLSAVGSCFLLLYFAFGKRDPIGFLSNLFPLGISLYNFYIIFVAQKRPVH